MKRGSLFAAWSLALAALFLQLPTMAAAMPSEESALQAQRAGKEVSAPAGGVAGVQNRTGVIPSAEMETRTFVILHKEMEEVVTLVSPRLSQDATVLLQARLHSVTITDRKSLMDEVASLIGEFDQPSHAVAIKVNLIEASRNKPGHRASLLPGPLPPSLRELTKWLDYQLLGGMSMLTAESDRSSLVLGEIYRIRFQVDLVDDRAGLVRLKDFVLERRQRDPGKPLTYIPIFDTVVNLKSGTPYVFGATRGEDVRNALFLSISADIKP